MGDVHTESRASAREDGGKEAHNIRLPDDLAKMPVLAVIRGSPAWDALLRMIKTTMGGQKLRPGQIIPVSEEELQSLRQDVLALFEVPAALDPKNKPV